MTKLKSLLKETNLGDLPSSKLFKLNKETGKYDKPISEGSADIYFNQELIDLILRVEKFQNLLKSIVGPKVGTNFERAVLKKTSEYKDILRSFKSTR